MGLQRLRDKIRNNFLGALILKLFSLVYLCLITLREYFYKKNLFKSVSINASVICFGNITTGGTGKTSAIIAVAAELKKRGYNPCVLTRGYKRKKSFPGKIEILHKDSIFSNQNCGDEALEIYHSLKDYGVPVMVSANRYRAGRLALNKFKTDVFLMDDGFQHFGVRRDVDIVLINASNPFGNGHLLPFGDLRESKKGLKRAKIIVLTHCEQVHEREISDLKTDILKIHPDAEILESMHQPEFFLNAVNLTRIPLNDLTGPVAVLSGIGDPKSFQNILLKLKLEIQRMWQYPDHHYWTLNEFKKLNQIADNLPIITTLKDFFRFPKDWNRVLTGRIYILSVKIVFLCNGHRILMDEIVKNIKRDIENRN